MRLLFFILGFLACSLAQTASQKQKLVWSSIVQTPEEAPWPSLLELAEIFLEDLSPTVQTVSDVFPEGRKKLVHSVGAVALARFNWNATAVSGYTGLFQKADYGLIRASSAVQPTDGSTKSFIPGISLKFFRSGDSVPSGNFFAMYQLDGQNDFNFFLNNFCNHVADRPDLPFLQWILKFKFQTVSEYPDLVGLSDFANYTQDGYPSPQPNFPFALVFQPNPQFTNLFSGTSDSDIPNLFAQTFVGDEVLYKVYAIADVYSTSADLLGTLQLSSKFYPSSYGDTKLFFKHQVIEEDWALRPVWETVFADENVKRWEVEGSILYSPWLPPF